MNEILISTTNELQGFQITKYINIVSTNVFFISPNSNEGFLVVDSSNQYRFHNKIQEMYKFALKQLKDEAKKINANCIVNIKFDISKSYQQGEYMLNALGTAVHIIDEDEYNLQRLKIEDKKKEIEEQNKKEQINTLIQENKIRLANSIEELLEIDEIKKEANTIKRLYGESRYHAHLKSKAREYGIEIDD